ncbi:MAG TPA: hypothetical protein VL147_05250 [Devosia sp.]|uniref:hypothetical protein n=1 Tax=Pararhizobium sp. TaxID=1977563 RepID=UPI002B554398|nr:hypothetical protein [Pararhizobium sp.]HTN60944.1 hypothetical protein [Devosia sp.]HTO32590.1 hypothetical protein [Pararhizobium sp.]
MILLISVARIAESEAQWPVEAQGVGYALPLEFYLYFGAQPYPRDISLRLTHLTPPTVQEGVDVSLSAEIAFFPSGIGTLMPEYAPERVCLHGRCEVHVGEPG